MKKLNTILMSSVLALGACKDDAPAEDAATETGDGDGDGDGDPSDPFTFAANDPSEYTRVDRMGMPAIATAVITSKDDYNAANPVDDANGDFVAEITTNLEGLHAALDDDLVAAGLTPCVVADCLAQAGPLVVPDTLALTIGDTSGFPNGRQLADPVIDVTLAVVLLDLTAPGQTATTFAELPINPAANDVEFSTEFPWLADPH
ncbi:MAG TPA: DUF4331 family protein [Enhygromyxa sp.]|nr:DUF4331 family protein [Enhygromyxa sp.]